MFDNLTDRLSSTLNQLSGRGQLTESNIKESIREVRKALLEADVALPVVTQFISEVKKEALGKKVLNSLKPGQVVVKVVYEALVRLMGEQNDELNLNAAPPAIVLMAGLQGAGKTTTTAKLARLLKERNKKSVMLVSVDVYRPAAIQQLETLAQEIEVSFFPSTADDDPKAIVERAKKEAAKQHIDVLIIDTAGRLHVDNDLMQEIKVIHQVADPIETLFVVDAMTGQDAANTAKAFDDALPLTGVVLTKTDGDARGGAALSVRQITGKPIKFIGTGEKTDGLEPFHPDRIASRILGKGDVLSLVEEAERKIDKKKADRLTNKIKKGRSFDLTDMLDQFQQMKNMGGMAGMLDKLPGMSGMAKLAENEHHKKEIARMEAVILSMTPKEREFPDSINGSRKRRIATGSGTNIQDVNRLLKQHKQMQKMVKKMSKKGGMKNMMRGMQSMMGGDGLPPM